MFNKWFGKSDFEILNDSLSELYAYLNIAQQDQSVLIEFNDPLKSDNLIVKINGQFWKQSSNPMQELRDLHNIIAVNIRLKRSISITIGSK